MLLERELIPAGGRIVSVSSIAGIAGNRGQTNYATSKAGVIGLVAVARPGAAPSAGSAINAVAPGFIETRHDRAHAADHPRGGPADEQHGRRAACRWTWPRRSPGWRRPASAAVSGNVVRVCGQSLLGA